MTSGECVDSGTRTDATGPFELDSFAAEAAAGSRRSNLVITTFNIRYGAGPHLISGGLMRRAGLGRPHDRHRLVAHNLEAAARALSGGLIQPAADMIALQEADRETLRAGRQHVARQLARALGMHYAHAAAGNSRDEEPKPRPWYLDFEERIARLDEGDTGIAILSRFPLGDVTRLELPWTECAWRPRLALAATIKVGGQSLRLINAHIDPHASLEGQLDQHRALVASTTGEAIPTALLGDFNTLTKRSRLEMRRLLEAQGFSSPLPTGTATWRAGLIRLHTDWIFVRGAVSTEWGVARPLRVSDHWPVWVKIQLESGGER